MSTPHPTKLDDLTMAASCSPAGARSQVVVYTAVREIEELRSKCDRQAFEIDELRAKNFAAHAAHSAELVKARQVTEQLYGKFRRVQTQLEQLTPGLLPALMAERAARLHLQDQLETLLTRHSKTDALRLSQRTENEELRRKVAVLQQKLVEAPADVEELRTKLEAAEIARDEALEDRAALIRKEAEHLQHQRAVARQLARALSVIDAHLRDAQSAAVQLT